MEHTRFFIIGNTDHVVISFAVEISFHIFKMFYIKNMEKYKELYEFIVSSSICFTFLSIFVRFLLLRWNTVMKATHGKVVYFDCDSRG